MASLLDYVVIGLLQGVFEWLPVSSKTIVLLYALYISGTSLLESYLLGLAVQAGTVLSAVLYYRDVFLSRRSLFTYKFIVVASVSTIITGLPLYFIALNMLVKTFDVGLITLLIGILLLATGIIHRLLYHDSGRGKDVSIRDAFYMGLAQGLAVFPGVSRSGVTVISLLARGVRAEDAFKYSFVSSIPANLGALLLAILTKEEIFHSGLDFTGLLAAFIVSSIAGYLTMDLLLKTARKHSWRTAIIVAVLTIIIGTLTILS